ncbi:MAG: permease [Hyphomicrobiaceae bacterium]
MSGTATLAFFARHELRLAWRDWVQLMSGGRRLCDGAILAGTAIAAIGIHGIAYAVLAPHVAAGMEVSVPVLVLLTGTVLLSLAMMTTQALEQVTRAFYARDDLDLILSSPAPARHLFSVRMAAIASSTLMMSGLIVTPFINVAAVLDGPRWLAAYGVLAALAAFATAIAIASALAMFRFFGPKRARLIAQIAAAVVGAAFLIGIQIVAILAYNSMSRIDVLTSGALIAAAPDLESSVWLPARAIAGNGSALAVVMAVAMAALTGVIVRASAAFGAHVVAANGMEEPAGRQRASGDAFRRRSWLGTLVAKEWLLLRRDPWLVSQSLMQVLYLIPPALMLWRSFGGDQDVATILAPVIVMATGQLAGGLAWLAISGEDAPDLVATAPVSPLQLLVAKVISVLALVGMLALPLVVAMAIATPLGGLATGAGVVVSACAAVVIQLLFRAQARRASFRRRQVASRASTFLEAFASILAAGGAGLMAAGSWTAIVPFALVLAVLGAARALRPRPA